MKPDNVWWHGGANVTLTYAHQSRAEQTLGDGQWPVWPSMSPCVSNPWSPCHQYCDNANLLNHTRMTMASVTVIICLVGKQICESLQNGNLTHDRCKGFKIFIGIINSFAHGGCHEEFLACKFYQNIFTRMGDIWTDIWRVSINDIHGWGHSPPSIIPPWQHPSLQTQ